MKDLERFWLSGNASNIFKSNLVSTGVFNKKVIFPDAQEELYDAAYDIMAMLEQRIKMADHKETQLLQSLGFSISDIPGYKVIY